MELQPAQGLLFLILIVLVFLLASLWQTWDRDLNNLARELGAARRGNTLKGVFQGVDFLCTYFPFTRGMTLVSWGRFLFTRIGLAYVREDYERFVISLAKSFPVSLEIQKENFPGNTLEAAHIPAEVKTGNQEFDREFYVRSHEEFLTGKFLSSTGRLEQIRAIFDCQACSLVLGRHEAMVVFRSNGQDQDPVLYLASPGTVKKILSLLTEM